MQKNVLPNGRVPARICSGVTTAECACHLGSAACLLEREGDKGAHGKPTMPEVLLASTHLIFVLDRLDVARVSFRQDLLMQE